MNTDKRYRMLQDEEIIKEGDEIFQDNGEWKPLEQGTYAVGDKYYSEWFSPTRRKLEKNLSLIEAVQSLKDGKAVAAYSESNCTDYLILVGNRVEDLVNSDTGLGFSFNSDDVLSNDWVLTNYKTYREYYDAE